MSIGAAFMDAWRNRDKLGDGAKQRQLAAFLPAALEIQETPPNPLTRWLAWSLLAMIIIGILWACFGQVNVVASAEGKIIPSSRVKQIQPLEKAVVKRILVSEGQRVEEGQSLVELDSALTLADEKRLTNELLSAKLRLSVNQTLVELLELSPEDQQQVSYATLALHQSGEATEHDVLLHKRLLWQKWQEYQAQASTLLSSLDRVKAEQAVARENIAKFKKTLPIITKRTQTLRDLHAKQFVSEVDYLQLEQERIQQQHDLAAEEQRLNQTLASEEELQQQLNAFRAQFSASQLAEMSENQRQISVLQEDLSKATDLNAKKILYSPVAGQVQELSISTVGGVVTDAQQLMLIVPQEESLEVEVFLENKDIGFVRDGMLAEIKIHTFPFTKYGVIQGEVTTVSDDAIVDEKRGLIYGMQLRMEKSTIMVDGKEVRLKPGMAVTAEVQTSTRRIIEFFLAPLLRYGQESLRER